MKTAMIVLTPEEARNYGGKMLASLCDEIDFTGEVMVDIQKNRNPGNHRRFFAFLKVSFAMQDFYDDKEVWRKVLQLKAGFFDEVVGDKGNVIYLPRSIDWSKLDELEFKDLFNRVVNAFLKDFGDKLDDNQINQIVGF